MQTAEWWRNGVTTAELTTNNCFYFLNLTFLTAQVCYWRIHYLAVRQVQRSAGGEKKTHIKLICRSLHPQNSSVSTLASIHTSCRQFINKNDDKFWIDREQFMTNSEKSFCRCASFLEWILISAFFSAI